MADAPIRLREIAWREIFPWLSVLPRAVRLAFSLRVLFLAAMAVFLTFAGVRLITFVFSGDDNIGRIAPSAVAPWPWEFGADVNANEAAGVNRPGYPQGISDLDPLRAAVSPSRDRIDPVAASGSSPLLTSWYSVISPFKTILDLNPTNPLNFAGFAYLLLTGLWVLVVWGLFGGAITRIAALELTRDDRLGVRGGLGHGFSRWGSYFLSVVVPLLGVMLIAIPVLLFFGLPLKSNFLTLVVSVFWPLVLIAGLLMTVLVVGLFFGWPLMWASIGVERDDWFGALGRGYSYVFQRPLHFFFYVMASAVLGILGYVVVALFASLVIHLGDWAASWGSGAETMREVLLPSLPREGETVARVDDSTMFNWGVNVIRFWQGLVVYFVQAFVFSLLFCSTVGIYLLLRRQVDATELDEVATDDEPAHNLPGIEPDAAGMPGVVEPTEPIVPPPTPPAGP